MASITEYSNPISLADMDDMVISGLTAGSTVDVTITDEDGTILDESLTADSSGEITITDMWSLLRERFEDKMLDSITVKVTGLDEVVLDVYYTNIETEDYAEFVKSNFLCGYTSKRTNWGRKEMLCAMSISDVLTTASVRAYFTDGTYEDSTIALESDSESSTSNTLVYVMDTSPDQFYDADKTMLRYVVQLGDRSMEYVIDPEHEDPSPVFIFRNSFGAWDTFYANGKLEMENTFEREGTKINGKYRNYKVEETRNYNVDTGILLGEEKEWVIDILRSKQVFLCKNEDGSYTKWKEATITESESKRTNEPESLPRYTFVCRLAERMQNILDISEFPKIFTKIYTKTYE